MLTIEMTPLEMAHGQYSDMYKEAFGSRPRGVRTSDWTLERFDEEFAVLAKIIEIDSAREKEAEQAAVLLFEQRVADLIATGAKDKTVALRWIHEAEDTDGDNDYLRYVLGLPYRYFEANGR